MRGTGSEEWKHGEQQEETSTTLPLHNPTRKDWLAERSIRKGRRKLIHRESFRASVLHLSQIQAVLESIAKKKRLLTTPSFLSAAPALAFTRAGQTCARPRALNRCVPLSQEWPDVRRRAI